MMKPATPARALRATLAGSAAGGDGQSRRALPGLQERRQALGFTQAELAERAAISVSFLYELETGRGRASPRVQAALAAGLDLPVDGLFAPSDGLTATEAARRVAVRLPTILAAIERGELRSSAREIALPDESGLPERLGAREVAELAAVSRRAVSQAIKAGRLEAIQGPDGAWQIRRDAALAYARAHALGRHEIALTELERWQAERERQRAAVRLALTCAFCGAEFERPRSGASGARAYCSPACYWQAHREPLLAAAGGCGSPTCWDPACAVPPGRCHREGCERAAFVASYTRQDIRWVYGCPTRYCSRRCAVLARNAGVPWQETYAELKAQGLVDLREAARRLGRVPPSILRHARRLGVGTRVEGLGAWFFDEDELAALERHIDESPTAVVHRDPRRRADWYRRRFKSTKLYGRLAPVLAAENGKKVGRPSLPAEKAEKVRELRAQGRSLRLIANRLHITLNEVRGALRDT